MTLIRQSSSRSVLAAGLISVLLAISCQPIRGLAGQTQTPRRGKNGVAKPDSPSADDSNSTVPPDSTNKKSAGTPKSSTRSANPSSSAGDTGRNKPNSDNRAPAQNKSSAEPPPFDRPPQDASSSRDSQGSSTSKNSRSSSRSRASSTPAESSSSSDDPSYNDPSPRSRNRPRSNDSSYDPPPGPERDGRQPPVLKREPSSTSPSQERQQPPVLKRSPSPGSSSSENREGRGEGDQTNSPRKSDSTAAGTGSDDTVKLSSTLVNIPLLVSDRNGRYVPKLAQRDFDLYEDGVKQEVAFFSSEEVPFSVALLLDVSPSVSGNLSDIQDAALEFIRQLRPQDRVMIVSFDRRTRFLTDFTSDRRTLEEAIHETRTGSGTSVYEAVYDTVTRRMIGVEGRKALILFSDGEDTTSSHASYDDAISAVSESEVLVYGLRYPGSGSNGGGGGGNLPWPFPRTRNPVPFPFPFPWPWPRRPGGHFNLNTPSTNSGSLNSTTAFPQRRRSRPAGDFMADVAAAGGGPVYDAQGVHDLSRLARQIAEELRHVYVISYYPTNALSNGGYRAVRVHVPNRPDIIVRCRRGYDAKDVTKGH